VPPQSFCASASLDLSPDSRQSADHHSMPFPRLCRIDPRRKLPDGFRAGNLPVGKRPVSVSKDALRRAYLQTLRTCGILIVWSREHPSPLLAAFASLGLF
jgi:hypothetical protein